MKEPAKSTLSTEARVLVVGANLAYIDYKDFYAYICQPNRGFRPFGHMAFYANQRIQRLVPTVVGEPIESVLLSIDGVSRNSQLVDEQRQKLLRIIKRLTHHRNEGWARLDDYAKVIFLSPPASSDTIRLTRVLVNDTFSKQDMKRRVPFVQGQTYVSLSSLLTATSRTSELVREASPRKD